MNNPTKERLRRGAWIVAFAEQYPKDTLLQYCSRQVVMSELVELEVGMISMDVKRICERKETSL